MHICTNCDTTSGRFQQLQNVAPVNPEEAVVKKYSKNISENPENPIVAAEIVIPGLPKPFFYEIPDSIVADTGFQVEVPLGNRTVKGWIVSVCPYKDIPKEICTPKVNKPTHYQLELKLSNDNPTPKKQRPLKAILSAFPSFPAKHLLLFRWMSEYYGCALADVIDNAIPTRSLGHIPKIVSLTNECKDIIKSDPSWLNQLEKRAPVQARVLKLLLKKADPSLLNDLSPAGPSSRTAITALQKKKWVQISNQSTEQIYQIEAHPNAQHQSDTHNLTTAQQHAVNNIIEHITTKTFSPLLLHGVTGSGKTEVYIRAIKHVLSKGGNALLIVPEIALTPQLVDQFHQRLNSPLAILHSQVGASARWSAWTHILNGHIHVTLGARSAIFAPFSDLNLIIVDEEHENSYKQNDGVRYSGRDVAIIQARIHKCPVVLGSATPSFESLVNVLEKRYSFLEMPERATTRPLPSIKMIDLSTFKRAEFPSQSISPPLYEAIKETLAHNQQVIVLYNRRGFSSYLQCVTCNEVVLCPQCSVALTFHKRKQRCICHYCGISITPPTLCPICRDPRTTSVECSESRKKKVKDPLIGKLEYRGGGTEKVVDELRELFPDARILRMDRDTVQRKEAYREILGKMRSKEADILVGTQMIAKGHDLPGVTLVGIMDADVGLHLPDFRASEKTFQLITQAAGRAGRGSEAGKVIVQTREPSHPTIVASTTGRFKAFARYELDYRKRLSYPPYGRLMRIITSSPDRVLAATFAKQTWSQTRHFANQLTESLKNNNETPTACSVIGPAPAAHEKLRGRYRWHVLVKSKSAKQLSLLAAMLHNWRSENKNRKEDLRLVIDIDPVDML